VSISFTYSTTTVTINKNPSYMSNWKVSRLNQYAQETVDGVLKVYDGGPNIVVGEIVLQNVVKSEGDALRNFLKDTVTFQLLQFTITPTPPSITDIGGGAGTALTTCNYGGGQSLEGVFEFIPPGKYNIRLPYRKII